MKICNVDEEGRFGGPERRISQVANLLKNRNDLSCTVIIPKLESEYFRKYLNELKVDYIILDITRLTLNFKILIRYILRFFIEIRTLKKYFKKNKIQIVHVNGTYQFKTAIAARIAKCKVLWHINSTTTHIFVKYFFTIISYFCSDGFIVASKKSENYYLNNFILKNIIKRKFIHAPVDVYKFDPKNFKKKDSEIIRIKIVSSINYQKGTIFCLEICESLLRKYNNIEIYFAGPFTSKNSNYGNKALRIIEKIKQFTDKFSYLGHLENIPEFLHDADIFFCPSKYEASPTSVWEAMSMEIAVITTDVGSIKENITNHFNGVITEHGNHNLTLKYFSELINDASKRKFLAKNARDYAIKNLSLEKAAALHYEAYKMVASN